MSRRTFHQLAALFLVVAASAVRLLSADPIPLTPKERIVLYDGKTVNDLHHFYVWLEKLGRDNDPQRVFTVVDQIDGAPAIRSSGEIFGGIVTREAYANYKVVLEFRWGNVTWGGRKERARNSGILLHCIGEPGSYRQDFLGPWQTSIEYEMIEGRMGDIILVSGFQRDGSEKLIPHLTLTETVERIWDPNGKPTYRVPSMGHLHWKDWDPTWKDVLGFHGAHDIDKPIGQWNTAEAIADGDKLVYFYNGVKVMEATGVWPTGGRLLFQSEGAEIFFRRIELLPLAR